MIRDVCGTWLPTNWTEHLMLFQNVSATVQASFLSMFFSLVQCSWSDIASLFLFLDDESVVHTTGRLLESELHCAICLDILRNTRTTKEWSVLDHQSIDWLIDWLVGRLFGRLIDWLISWLISWSVDWLFDWSLDSVCLFFYSNCDSYFVFSLHRFCYECIQKALTQESEESEERDRKCPCCRKKLVSMRQEQNHSTKLAIAIFLCVPSAKNFILFRSLRPDPLFDALIKTILPDIHKSGGGLVDLPVDGSSVAGTSRNHTAATDLDLGEPRLHLEIFPYTEQVQHLAKIMKNWSPRRRLVKVGC